MTAETFMAEFNAQTEPHPLLPDRRVYLGVVMFEVSAYLGNVHLGEIIALEKRRGYGTTALHWLCELADKHQVAIGGRAFPIKKTGGGVGLNMDHLVAWYRRNGFEISGDDSRSAPRSIFRRPKQL